MILRIQTPDGMKRLEVGGADTVNALYEKVRFSSFSMIVCCYQVMSINYLINRMQLNY